MLISFTLENYKSFKKRTTLEMSPGNSRMKNDHISNDCLKTAAIFGGNASGKSNMIKGLKTMKNIVIDPYYTTKDPIYNWEMPGKETFFEVVFSVGNNIYTYSMRALSIGNVSDKISRQSFSYIVTYEKLTVSDLNYSTLDGESCEETLFENIIDNKIEYTNNWVELVLSNNRRKELLSTNYKNRDEIKITCSIIKKTIKMIETEGNDSSSKEKTEKLEQLKNRLQAMEKTKRNLTNSIYRLKKSIEHDDKVIEEQMTQKNKYTSLLKTKKYDEKGDHVTATLFEKKDPVYRWFMRSLVILETDDFYFPLDRPTLLKDLSEIIDSIDVGIIGLDWVPVHKKDIQKIEKESSEKDRKRIELCKKNSLKTMSSVSLVIRTKSGIYLFNHWMGDTTLQHLSTVHKKNEHTKRDETMESDGTRRMIELASTLLPGKEEITYVIDELDRRLHPLMTRQFIELFMNNTTNDKQLIFTTHETRLLTTELFRPDEIWFVDRNDETSMLQSLDSVDIKINGRIDRLYLDTFSLPGIPKIRKIDNN